MPVIPAMQKAIGRRIVVPGWPRKKKLSCFLKNNLRQKGLKVCQVVESLPRKHEPLSSDLNTTKRNDVYIGFLVTGKKNKGKISI
jgi:hypothetical protein